MALAESQQLGDEPATAMDAEEAGTAQFVTFFLDDECYAFEMASVLEIIRAPETVPVPKTPTALRGLANLRGTVLPIVDLRTALGLGRRDDDEATRVVVTDCGRPVGLVVDRVARVLEVDTESIESAEGVEGTIRSDLLNGVIKGVEGHDLVSLFDAPRLVAREFPEATAEETEVGAGETLRASRAPGADEEDDEDSLLRLVSLLVDGQEYAFEIANVEEIVRVPEDINEVPGSGREVLGLINLRGRILPLVGLRRIFGLPEAPIEDRNRIVVVSIDVGGGRRTRIGVVVDEVREVLRVPAEIRDSVPELLCDESDKAIGAICRLDGGRRLVPILEADALFGHPAVRAALDAGGDMEETTSDMVETTALAERHEVEEGEETQIVVFHLADQEYGAPIEAVQEIIAVPEAINRVPKTPDFIEGLINLRGGVLPVMEMRLRFGLERDERNDRHRILVLNVGSTRAGFIVDAVTEVLRLQNTLIEDAPRLSDEQSRLMGRIAKLDEGRRMIPIIDAERLLEVEEIEALGEGIEMHCAQEEAPSEAA